jgi:hypothetical protein
MTSKPKRNTNPPTLGNVSGNRFDKLRSERRAKRVPVELELIARMFLEGETKRYKAEGLPRDAIFYKAGFNEMDFAASFIYLHESFPPVKEGVVIPSLQVWLTQTEALSNPTTPGDVSEPMPKEEL